MCRAEGLVERERVTGWPLPGAEGVVPWGVGLGKLATEGEWGRWGGDRETQDGVRVLRGAGAYPSLRL